MLDGNFLGRAQREPDRDEQPSWCRSRAIRRCPRVAGPAAWTSAACTTACGARRGSAARRSVPVAAHRCAPANQILQRTTCRASEYRFGPPATAAMCPRHRAQEESSTQWRSPRRRRIRRLFSTLPCLSNPPRPLADHVEASRLLTEKCGVRSFLSLRAGPYGRNCRIRSSPSRGLPRPSRLLVVNHSVPSGAAITVRRRPYCPTNSGAGPPSEPSAPTGI